MTEDNAVEKKAVPEKGGSENAEKKEKTELFVPVEFEDGIKELTVEEAAHLAEKGLEYETVEPYYRELQKMAEADKKSVPQFLEQLKSAEYEKRLCELAEKCGGDRDMAEHVIRLEGERALGDTDGLSELKAYFPEISGAEQLPEAVIKNARLENRPLLDEYLRYRFKEGQRARAAQGMSRAAISASTGSQADRAGISNPVADEFLKGLWK